MADGGVNEAMAELTGYRRKIRRPNEDDEKLNVVFNDYMNCLMGRQKRKKGRSSTKQQKLAVNITVWTVAGMIKVPGEIVSVSGKNPRMTGLSAGMENIISMTSDTF